MKMISRVSLTFALAISALVGAQLLPDGSADPDRRHRDRVTRNAAPESVLKAVQSSYERSAQGPGRSKVKNSDIAAAAKSMSVPQVTTAAPDRIMFASNRGGTFDLYSMNEDGTDVRLVVGGPRDELHSDISPDGNRIVFVRADDVVRSLGPQCCGPVVDLFLANANGSGVTPLMPDPVIDDYRPDWSPDGTQIAFTHGSGGGLVSNIFTVKPDGSDLAQVTDGILGNSVASWSPDGTQLVFFSSRDGTNQIWVTDADGGNPHPITDSPPGVFNTSPQWSPRGDRIVFGSDRDGGASELYTVAPDGSELTRLTTNTLSDSYATWSPDGKRIAFSRGLSSTTSGAIWVMNADGSDERQISDGPFDTFPVFFPRAFNGESIR